MTKLKSHNQIKLDQVRADLAKLSDVLKNLDLEMSSFCNSEHDGDGCRIVEHDEHLNECYWELNEAMEAGGLTRGYAYYLKDTDKPAYRASYLSYVEELPHTDFDDYNELQEQFAIVEEKQSELIDLETELEALDDVI